MFIDCFFEPLSLIIHIDAWEELDSRDTDFEPMMEWTGCFRDRGQMARQVIFDYTERCLVLLQEGSHPAGLYKGMRDEKRMSVWPGSFNERSCEVGLLVLPRWCHAPPLRRGDCPTAPEITTS
jgi:hypothetical protein